MNDYGYFDDAAREYVITDPFPPAPWINYLSNGHLCTIISQKGGGMTFLDSSVEQRFTRYHQDRGVPQDRPGHYLYLREQDGTIWSPTFDPTRTPLDEWECRHGMGYTTFCASYRGVTARLRFFVPPDDNVLLWELALENHRQGRADLLVTPYVEFGFLQAMREVRYWHWCRYHNTFTYDPKLSAIRYYYGTPEALKNMSVFLSGSGTPAGFDCSRDAFLGRGGREDAPESLLAGKLTGSELPGGGHGCGALGYRVRMKPGQRKRLCFALGGAETWQQAGRLIRKYRKEESVDRAFGRLGRAWNRYLDVTRVEVPDPAMQSFVNIWNPYNCRAALERARWISAVHTGMGGGLTSRDSMQDAQSIAHLHPAWARDRIRVVLGYQCPDGRFWRSFDPVTGSAPEAEDIRSDNGVWSILTTHAYLAETGDFDFLKVSVAYYGGKPASVFDHLYHALTYIYEHVGKNGLPLLYDMDWNDSLYLFAEEGAESVMLAQQLVYACGLLGEIAEKHGKPKVMRWCERVRKELTATLNSGRVWDGQWYRRLLYSGRRTPLGSARRREGKLFLNTQAWAVIAQVASQQRGETCMDRVHEHLATPYGLQLLWPAYTGIPEPEDPLVSNRPGVGENAGIFNHAFAWGIMAEALLGRGDRAFQYYRNALPNVLSEKVGSERYLNEPYAWSSHIIGPPDERAGQALLSWLSGTTTWMYVAATQYILGIRPTLDGLLINPGIPAEWATFTVRRRYRGTLYIITVRNPDHVNRGVQRVFVNGVEQASNLLSGTDRRRVRVEVILGKDSQLCTAL